MRPYILKALLLKEFRRHVANRGGLALGLLLVVAAVLLSVFDPGAAVGGGGGGGGASGMVGGVHHCFVEYGELTPFVARLQKSVPPELESQIVFRAWPPGRIAGMIDYPPGVGGIHVRPWVGAGGKEELRFQIWHPAGNPGVMAPYEQWFFREARTALGGDATKVDGPADDLWAVRESFARLKTGPAVVIDRQGLAGEVLDIRSAVATGMVVFALYFACVYLLPTLNCEERERGVLLAQALSPASPAEILAAKFLFYPGMGIGLAAVLAGIYKPGVLSTPFFWLSLVAVAGGFLGIGMTVATLAKTQRAAFLGAMCYLMSVSLLLFICATNGIPLLSNLAVEFHGPRILHAALTGKVQNVHWLHLLASMGLAAGWLTVAGVLFRRRGWQ